jgi:hypothetical protein
MMSEVSYYLYKPRRETRVSNRRSPVAETEDP